MAFISVTRLRLRSKRFLLVFLIDSLKSTRQARRAPGFLGGKLMGDGKSAFWTVTAWEDEDAMKSFMISGPHRKAMPKLLNWCDEASIAHWVQDDATLPSMREAHRRMRDEGRISKVLHPSERHAAKQTAEPECALKFENPIRPARPSPSPATRS
ncbi:MAG: antibiotic biosynthesis monooxygenase [Armatimonadetes bacterium]|nr:antibiotic biosynthesis monooxygenase [Armatimonadota bacterium]